MGYYTQHELEIEPYSDEIMDYIRENEKNAYYAIGVGDSCKWYSHESDMRRISQRFPDHLFILGGEGEELGDIWKEYYRNGKMQRCDAVITFEPFDESKMK